MTINNNTLYFDPKRFSNFFTLLMRIALATSIIGYRLALPQKSIAEGEQAISQHKFETIHQKKTSLKEASKNTSLKFSPSEAKAIIENRAKEVILAIKKKDMVQLSTFIHPEKGVRFSPYAHVAESGDIVFSAPQVRKLLTDNKKYEWGGYDGSGEPIELTPKEYFNKFVYNRDFANVKEITYNQIIRRGSTINNSFEVYPEAIIVEYYFPGFEAKYQGMDWASLRLVFEKKDSIWYLVGTIHDQWTI